jgi:Tfp pilus assembly protein PilV
MARDLNHSGEATRTNTAFMVESLVLLVVFIAALAIFVSLFSQAISDSDQAKRLSSATYAAQNAAEEFSANPKAVANGETVAGGYATDNGGDFQIDCHVESTATKSGTLYTAHIVVSDKDGEAYSLDTTRYVSEVK